MFRLTLSTGLILAIIVAAAVYLLLNYNRSSACTVLQTIPLADSVNVEIVGTDCQEGLPHTTDSKTIRMTQSIWEGPRRDAVLAHERVHLAQKSNVSAAEWRRFYERAWGYKCYSKPPSDVPAEFVARLRPNPDTADSPWALWRNRWLFFPAFNAEGSLRGAEVIVWDIENHRQVMPPAEWRDEFCGKEGCPHQYEHPHEISAEWLAARSVKCPAAEKLFAWQK